MANKVFAWVVLVLGVILIGSGLLSAFVGLNGIPGPIGQTVSPAARLFMIESSGQALVAGLCLWFMGSVVILLSEIRDQGGDFRRKVEALKAALTARGATQEELVS